MKIFSTNGELASATLNAGQYVETLGAVFPGDGDGAKFYIENATYTAGVDDIDLVNGNVARKTIVFEGLSNETGGQENTSVVPGATTEDALNNIIVAIAASSTAPEIEFTLANGTVLVANLSTMLDSINTFASYSNQYIAGVPPDGAPAVTGDALYRYLSGKRLDGSDLPNVDFHPMFQNTSVTELLDVTDAGSGAIITGTERTNFNDAFDSILRTGVLTGGGDTLTFTLEDGSFLYVDVSTLNATAYQPYKGTYVSELSLTTTHPTALVGDYADVDLGIGEGAVRYIWDDDDSVWRMQLGASSSLSDAQVAVAYSNEVDVVSQVNAEAGISSTVYRWTPERVGQAIAALAPVFDGDSLATYTANNAISLATTGDPFEITGGEINLKDPAAFTAAILNFYGVTDLVEGIITSASTTFTIRSPNGDMDVVGQNEATLYATTGDAIVTSALGDTRLTAGVGKNILLDKDPTVALGATTKQFVENLISAPSLVIQKSFADTPYTAAWMEDIEVDCSGGDVTINLPTAVGNNGKVIYVTKVDSSANKIIIDGFTAETINGSLTRNITGQYNSLCLKSNNTNVGIR